MRTILRQSRNASGFYFREFARSAPIWAKRSPAMTNISGHWFNYRVWAADRYLVWIAHGGLIAAFALAFALVLK